MAALVADVVPRRPYREPDAAKKKMIINRAFSVILLAVVASACAQQHVQSVEQSLSEQIAQAELRLNRLKLQYTELWPGIIVAERAIWELESQLPAQARASALHTRLVVEQQHLNRLMAGGASEDEPSVRRAKDRLRYLDELLMVDKN